MPRQTMPWRSLLCPDDDADARSVNACCNTTWFASVFLLVLLFLFYSEILHADGQKKEQNPGAERMHIRTARAHASVFLRVFMFFALTKRRNEQERIKLIRPKRRSRSEALTRRCAHITSKQESMWIFIARCADFYKLRAWRTHSLSERKK